MRSLTARLATAFGLLMVLSALVFGAAGYVTTERQVTGQVDSFLRNRAEDIVGGQRSRPDHDNRRRNNDNDDNNDPADSGLETVEAITRAVESDSIVQLIDPQGSVITTTGLELPVNDDDLDIASGQSNKHEIRTIDVAGEQLRVITAGFPEGGAVQVARFLSESNSLTSSVQSNLVAVALIATALAALVGAVLAQRITNPIRRLAASVDRVATTGDFSTPINVEGQDEVGRLAAGFDNLLNSLATSQEQQNQLVQDVAHDLRTPLTSIRANVDLLSVATDLDPDERRQTLASLKLELRELTELINEIVGVAGQRGSTGDHVPVDLGGIANEAAKRFQLRTGRDVAVTTEPTMVNGNREALIRAASNLLSNADKYSPSDTPVLISVSHDGWLRVADRGPGIPAADHNRVFDRFYRADSARSEPGSGLGLAIVKAIATEHGGRVEVADNPGGGAVVSFYVPPRPAGADGS